MDSPSPTPLPNNDAGIAVAVLESGALAVAFNNRAMRERCPLSVALSEDDGRTWPWVRDLERCDGQEEQQDRVRGDRVNYEYSNPAVRANACALRSQRIPIQKSTARGRGDLPRVKAFARHRSQNFWPVLKMTRLCGNSHEGSEGNC